MNRADKIATVERLNRELSETPHVIVATFNGLSVNQANDLRGRVRAAGGRYQVIKNRLTKLAVKGTPAEGLAESLSGPCALATHESDPVALAKALADFVKDNEQLQVLAGVVDGKDLVDAAGVKYLSSLPGLPELRAQLLALIQTPATTLVRLINTPAGQLARVVDARCESQGGAPTEE